MTDLTILIAVIALALWPLAFLVLRIRHERKKRRDRLDRMRLTQVITNFLGNAKKFTSQGHIKLGYFCDKEKKEIHFFVEDTGAGIPKEELQMIFERFYKRNEFVQGVGLGLAISKVIVEKMNGHIDVQSEVNKGSRFTAVLPYL